MEAALLSWFHEHGRDLPWRRTRDPYAILVSEVMLQQTQVDRVVPRYREWLALWPTAHALAAARSPTSSRPGRASAITAAQSACTAPPGGSPSDGWPDDLTELPGVGPYTAAAVSSFALGRPVLPVDTNVARVQERTGETFSHRSGQALMDLGATICLARIPRCQICPLAFGCPSRGRRYEPRRKQSRFEGSFRQRRASTCGRVAEKPRPCLPSWTEKRWRRWSGTASYDGAASSSRSRTRQTSRSQSGNRLSETR